MKRASAQEAAAERCRLATLPLLAFDPAYDDRPNANVAAPRQTERLQRKPEKSPLSMTYAHLCHAETAFSDEAAKRRPIKSLVKS